MVWPRRSNQPSDILRLALEYSHQFNYPLTPSEVWFWQPFTRYPESALSSWPYSNSGYFFLKGHQSLVNLRRNRLRFSQFKLSKAHTIGRLLKLLPTVRAVFVTGALAMNNCPRNDDIDIMIITSPHTLWLTRPFLVLALRSLKLRRDPQLPEHSSPRVNNKICDNLYLDLLHLTVTESRTDLARDFYLAHEIIQAKPLFDRGGVHRKFLTANSWVKHYLPIAYHETLKHTPSASQPHKTGGRVNLLVCALNYLFFVLQYLHMRSRFSRESVGLGYAFFHPRATVV